MVDEKTASKHVDPRTGATGKLLAIGFIALALAPLLGAWLTGLEPAGLLQEFATALGLTAGAMLLLQFFSSGRYHSLSGRVGLDRTIGFHRVAAYGLMLFAVLHPLVYVAATFVTDPAAAWTRLVDMVASPRLRTGVIAVVGLLLLVALSALRSRLNWRYETWRASHGLIAAVVAGSTLHHAMTAGSYSSEPTMRWLWIAGGAAAAAALLNIYVLRPWRMWRQGWVVQSVKATAKRSWEMTLRLPAGSAFDFQAGQFIWMTIAPNSPPFHDHPFSIASAPSELPNLRLIVREAGDCTNDFGTVKPGTSVAVDGPYGSFTLQPAGGRVVMIAGGVGIAPLMGMLEQAASENDKKSFKLLYAAQNPEELASIQRLHDLRSRLDLEIICYVDAGAVAPVARPGPIQSGDIADALGPSPADVAAYVCGPPRMMERMTDLLLESGVPPGSVHYERFDYAAGRSTLDRSRGRQVIGILLCITVGMVLFSLR